MSYGCGTWLLVGSLVVAVLVWTCCVALIWRQG
jgi:hypothetical protein